MRERNIHLAVALDGLRKADMLSLAAELQGQADFYKLTDALCRYGSRAVHWLRQYGKVFADEKLADIPRTVANEVGVYRDAGAALVTVHAHDYNALVSAVDATKPLKKSPLHVVAVTELTSRTGDGSTKSRVLEKVDRSVRAGVQHATSPASIVPWIRRQPLAATKALVCIVPGVRPTYAPDPNGQEQTATPAEIIQHAQGRDVILVVGTPILESHKYGMSPLQMITKIRQEMQEALIQAA